VKGIHVRVSENLISHHSNNGRSPCTSLPWLLHYVMHAAKALLLNRKHIHHYLEGNVVHEVDNYVCAAHGSGKCRFSPLFHHDMHIL